MRILLAQNSFYRPSYSGGDDGHARIGGARHDAARSRFRCGAWSQSNRLLLDAMAARIGKFRCARLRAAAEAHPEAPLMRILLAQNSLYHPSHEGGDISNRLPLAALPARIGNFDDREHEEFLQQPVAAASYAGAVTFQRAGFDVHVVERLRRRSARKHP